MKPVPKFQIEAIKVYPTAKPEEARELEPAPQTTKQNAISAVGLDPAVIKALGRVTKEDVNP